MPTTNARTGASAMPDASRSAWGSLTQALSSVSAKIRAALDDTWKRVPVFCIVDCKHGPAGPPAPPLNGRWGDPVGVGDARAAPVARSGPEPRALDQVGGENRAVADTQAAAWTWAAVAAGVVGVALLARR